MPTVEAALRAWAEACGAGLTPAAWADLLATVTALVAAEQARGDALDHAMHRLAMMPSYSLDDVMQWLQDTRALLQGLRP